MASILQDVKIRSWDDTIGFLFFAVPSGLAAYVILNSCHPLPHSFISSLGFVLLSGLWLAIFLYSAARALSLRTMEITSDGVRDDLRFLGWRIRSRFVSFQKPHFVDIEDYRGGFPVARERTRFLFVGPGSQIPLALEKERALRVEKFVPPSVV